MSTNTYPNFFDSQLLGSANGTLYTVPSSPTSIILQDMQLKISNTTTATHTVTLYAVASGGSASTTNAIVVDMSVPPNDYIVVPIPRIAAGGTVQGYSDTAGVMTVQAISGKLHTP